MLYPLLVLTALAAAAPETHVLEHPSLTSYSVDPDTAWVDHSRPILKKEAIHQLVELFAAGRFRGACLHGDVENRVGLGKVAIVERATSAAFPERCTGFSYVGAIIFVEPDEGSTVSAESDGAACELLSAHPEWGVAGEVSGLAKQTLRNSEGRIVDEMMAPVAWFCGWNRTAVDSGNLVTSE